MSAVIWDDEITMEPVDTGVEVEEADLDQIEWDSEVTMEPVEEPHKDADALAISEQVLREYPNDADAAQAELNRRLEEAGVDQQEIEDRTGAFHRFQTGLSKSLISAYNGITGAEEGDTSYTMETMLNQEVKDDTALYKATNITNKLDRDESGDYTGTTSTTQAQEHASTLGEVAPVMAAGIAGGTVATGAVGSAIGAGVADIAYTGAQAMSEQSDVGVVDVALSAIFGAAGASMARILNPKNLKAFTTIDNMPPKERKAVEYLAEKSGLSIDEMEAKIIDYKKSTQEGTITNRSAVEGAAKASEKEQIGFTTEAMRQSDSGKKKVLEETTKRTNIVEDALRQMDDELETGGMLERIMKKHTIDDEGRRKATDWKGLAKSLKAAGLDEEDEVYKRVMENAETFGTKETDIFQATVRPAKADTDKAIELIQPFTETTRASIGSQLGATNIGFIDKFLTKVLPNADTKTVNLVKKAMQEVKTPKELEQRLIDEGIEKHIAKSVANAHKQALKENEDFDIAKVKTDEKQAKIDAKEQADVDKARKKIVADAEKKQKIIEKGIDDLDKQTAKAEKDNITRMNKVASDAHKEKTDKLINEIEDWKSENVIPSDLGKKLNRAKAKGDWDAVEKIKDEIVQREVDKQDTIAKGLKTKKRKEVLTKGKKASERTADEKATKLAKKEKRSDVLKKGLDAKSDIEADHADLVWEQGQKKKLRTALDNKTAKSEAKAKKKATKEAEDEAKYKAKIDEETKATQKAHQDESDVWEDHNPISGYGKRYATAKKRYKESIGGMDETELKGELDSLREEIVTANKAKVEASQAKKTIESGTNQTNMDDFVEHKPLSQRAKDKIVQYESGKTGRSPQELNSMQGDEYSPVPDIAYDKDQLSQKELMDAEKQMNKNLGAKKMHEIEAGEEAKQVENALKSNDLREDHREALGLVIADPQYSKADKVLAEERIGKLDREKAGVIMRARTEKKAIEGGVEDTRTADDKAIDEATDKKFEAHMKTKEEELAKRLDIERKGYEADIEVGKKKGATLAEKGKGSHSQQKLDYLDIEEEAVNYPKPTSKQDYIGNRMEKIRKWESRAEAQKAMKEIRQRRADIKEKADYDALPDSTKNYREKKGTLNAIEDMIDSKKKAGEDINPILAKDLEEAKVDMEVASGWERKDAKARATASRDIAVKEVDGLPYYLDNYTKQKEAGGFDGSWAEYMVAQPEISRNKIRQYYKAHDSNPSKATQAYLDGDVTKQKENRGIIEAGFKTPAEKLMDRGFELFDEPTSKALTDLTNDKMGKVGKKSPVAVAAKELYKAGKMTKAQVSDLFNGKVPYEITRGKDNW